jgi:hypothetical protein
MAKKATTELHDCPECRRRRTRKAVCETCRKINDKKARNLATLAARPGTPANLGAEAFLASLATPDGFARKAIVDRWGRGEPDYPGVEFTGHGGQTTIKIIVRRLDDEYSAGDGHTTFTTSRGSFSFDRTGVEDSFYVYAKDTVAAVDERVREQVARVVSSRERHERSETVPMVGHVVTPERKAEIAATLKAGKGYDFRPAGFGTGYHVSTSRRACGPFVQKAPAELARFFGVADLYYETMDCD